MFVYSLPAVLGITAIITYRIFQSRLGGQFGLFALLLMVTVAMSVAPLYVPFFNKNIYLGQGSPNVWHNATVVFLRPFAIGAFFLFGRILGDPLPKKKVFLVATCLVIVAGSLIKPTFVLVFIPALLVYLVMVHPRYKTKYSSIALILLPAFLAIEAVDSVARYGEVGRFAGRTIAFVPFTVWAGFTPSIPLSLLITLAFPLMVLLSNFRSLRKDPILAISWLMTLAGILQAGLLAEKAKDGVLLTSHNWIGGYLVALTILFYVSIIYFFKGIRGVEFRWNRSGPNNQAILFHLMSAVLLAGHTISGCIYYSRILQQGAISSI